MMRWKWLGVSRPGKGRQPWRTISAVTLELDTLEDRVLPSIQPISVADPSLLAISAGAYKPDAISEDGHIVTFESQNDNLVPGINNNAMNLFARNVQTGTTALVDVTPIGTSGNAGLGLLNSVMTPDGRYVVFDSWASDLTSDPTNGFENVFVRDLQAGTTRLVSVNNSGTAGGFGYSSYPRITPDGRYIVFHSFARDLVQGTLSVGGNFFVRDMVANKTTLVTVNTTGTDGSNNTSSGYAYITSDGRYVAFSSAATNLISGFGDANFDNNVFVRDLMTGMTIPVSVAESGSGGGNGQSNIASISDNGRYVVFWGYASNLVPGKTNHQTDIFERDLVAQTTSLVSVNPSGVSGNSDSFRPTSSSDGRFVAFEGHASDLVSNDNNNNEDVFVRDMVAGTTSLVSQNSSGTGSANGYSFYPSITADGSSVAFLSYAPDLVSTVNVNGVGDVFIRNLKSGTTSLVSVNLSGNGGGNYSTQSIPPVISISGAFVAFDSPATNLVPGILSNLGDVYLRNLSAPSTTLISIRDPALPSVTGNGGSTIQDPIGHRTDVSANGRYVVFTSTASNLVPGDNNGLQDVFVRDTWNSTTTLVSVNRFGTGGGDRISYQPSISADGRFVAFTSHADDLVSGGVNGGSDVYVRDLINGTTTMVSVADPVSNGIGGDSNDPVISANGRFVVFESAAENLVPNPVAGGPINFNVFERDLVNQTTILVSVNINGAGTTFGCTHPVVSPDGRFVAFLSGAIDLVPGDSNHPQEVFLRDMVAGTTQMVSLNNAGAPGNSPSNGQAITPDGRYLVFESNATNLTSGAFNAFNTNIFVRDLQAGTTSLVSANATNGNPGNGSSHDAVISDNGHYVVFDSMASDLVSGDNNNQSDIFRRDLQEWRNYVGQRQHQRNRQRQWCLTISRPQCRRPLCLFHEQCP